MATKEEKERAALELAEAAKPLLQKIGLEGDVLETSLRKSKFTQALVDVITEAGVQETGCSKSQGNLLYQMATKFPANALVHRPLVCQYVLDGRIRTTSQLDGACEHLRKLASAPLGDAAAFELASGVGVAVSPEQMQDAARRAVAESEARLVEQRYRVNLNAVIGPAARELKWADAALLRAAVEKEVALFLGPRTAEDDAADAEAAAAALSGEKRKPAKSAGAPRKAVAAAAVGGGAAAATTAAAAAAAAGGAAAAAAAAASGGGAGAGGDERPASAAAATAAAAALTAAVALDPTAAATSADSDPYAFMPRPEDNNGVHTTVALSDGATVLRVSNTPEQLGAHLAATGGRVVTRFPPEPNGYLHIGHAKAMFVDFGMAERYQGRCYLRYDDTNPTAEKEEYIHHIREIVAWMGWKPFKVTYASDHFDTLHSLAVELIERGHAFVCHQTKAEIEASRERGEASPWRDRPAEESLRLFDDMRRGLLAEGEATLRMRMDHRNENPAMWDSVAYRIKYLPHPHAGPGWCVYPSYDFTHCLCDSLENVTHSLCTLEFETRRASYYWLLDKLSLYKPVVWEYSRLNVTNTVMSKRKLNRLVTEGHVKGWDDPRLLTLAGLRRRGATPGAINAFCREIGITRNANVVPYHRLEHHVRAHLDAASPRALAVLRPLKVVLTNLPEGHEGDVGARRFPGRAEGEAEGAARAAGYAGDAYLVPVSRVVYIEATDFREEDARGYYGLAPGKSAMLRYAFPITVTGFEREGGDKGGAAGAAGGGGNASGGGGSGAITAVLAEADLTFAERAAAAAADPSLPKVKPPKGVLNWVGQPKPGQEPPRAEVRLYSPLFRSEAPEAAAAAAGGGADAWLSDLDPASFEVVEGAMLTPELARDAASALAPRAAGKGGGEGGESGGGGGSGGSGGAPAVAGKKRYQWERLGYYCVDPDSEPGVGGAAPRLVFNRTATLREGTAVKKV